MWRTQECTPWQPCKQSSASWHTKLCTPRQPCQQSSAVWRTKFCTPRQPCKQGSARQKSEGVRSIGFLQRYGALRLRYACVTLVFLQRYAPKRFFLILKEEKKF